MAKKAISRIKIRSTGKTYDIKPDGYDYLYALVNQLCDMYGIARPNKNSYSDSTSPESALPPSGGQDGGGQEGESEGGSTKPTKGPSLRANSISEYLPSMGDIRIYDDSSYRFITGDDENMDIYVPVGKLVTEDGGYQAPEVRNLPVDITVTKILLDNGELLLTNDEGVYDTKNDEVIVRKYVDVPASTLYTECGYHSFQLHFTDNYSGSNNRPNIGVTTVFKYNFADGLLRIYDNGCYRIVPYGETSGTPSQQGIFFKNSIDLSTFERCNFSSKSYTFDENEDVYEFYKDNLSGDRYTIDFYSKYSNQTSIDMTANQENVIKSGTEYVQASPFKIEAGTVKSGGNHECIELGENSILSIRVSHNGRIRADKVIVRCKKGQSASSDTRLTVNGVGPYEPTDNSNEPSDLVFEISYDTAIEKIILESTQSILVDSITVVKHNFDGGVIPPVNHGYFTIEPADFRGSLMTRDISIKSSASLYSYGTISISPYDSRISITFTKREVVLDRSDGNSITTQLRSQGGETLFDFINIDVGEGVDYLDDTMTIEESIKQKIYFFIDRYSPGSSTYTGSSITISGGDITQCTWKKDTVDVVKIRYSGRNYDSTLNVRVIQTTDDVYIRRMNVKVYNTLYLGNTYTLRDFVTFVPEDVVNDNKYFKHFEIVHHAPEWSVLNNTMDFSFITTKEYVTRTPATLTPENAPTNWQEFWNWITITPIKTGSFTLYYLFRTDIGGGGGEVKMTIKDRP